MRDYALVVTIQPSAYGILTAGDILTLEEIAARCKVRIVVGPLPAEGQ